MREEMLKAEAVMVGVEETQQELIEVFTQLDLLPHSISCACRGNCQKLLAVSSTRWSLFEPIDGEIRMEQWRDEVWQRQPQGATSAAQIQLPLSDCLIDLSSLPAWASSLSQLHELQFLSFMAMICLEHPHHFPPPSINISQLTSLDLGSTRIAALSPSCF